MAKNEHQLFLYWKVRTHVRTSVVCVRIDENCQSRAPNDCLLMTARENSIQIDCFVLL